jgi:hypothetical protein
MGHIDNGQGNFILKKSFQETEILDPRHVDQPNEQAHDHYVSNENQL